MSVVVDFSVVPLGRGEHLSPFVARCEKIVRASGLPNVLHAMGTEIEADTLRQAFDLIEQCVGELGRDCDRVSVTIKADVDRTRSGRLRGKVESVEKLLK